MTDDTDDLQSVRYIYVDSDWTPVTADQLRDMAWEGLVQWNEVKPDEGVPKPLPLARAPAGRNEPCPCGSGKKYKRCCRR